MGNEDFKVIVVGGGPVGLTAAHVYDKANIDYVVLERRPDVEVDTGASLVLYPSTLRIFHQFGLLDELLDLGAELITSRGYISNGQCIRDERKFRDMKYNHGTAVTAFHRADFVRFLHQSLPDQSKSKLRFNKQVIDIDSREDGVTVTCADGSSYEGDMVLGADGVHSQTRRLMRSLALREDKSRKWDPEVPFTSEYKALWCSAPKVAAEGLATDTSDKDRSVMFISGQDRCWMFLYEKLPEKTKERHDYTEKDMLVFADRFAEYPVTETIKVKDIFEERMTVGMSDLQEGTLDHWTWGRIALVGDSAHKFTPNLGHGYNSGVQDLLSVSNEIYSALGKKEKEATRLAHEDVTAALEAFETSRKAEIGDELNASATYTRVAAWKNWAYYLIGRFLLSYDAVGSWVSGAYTRPTFCKGRVLDFVHGTEHKALIGHSAWNNSIPE